MGNARDAPSPRALCFGPHIKRVGQIGMEQQSGEDRNLKGPCNLDFERLV